MNPLLQIRELGQQIWLDNLSRALLNEGTLARLVADGIAGVTTNPSIFHKAIASAGDYAADLVALKARALSAEARYEQLVIPDVQRACDLLHECYQHSKGMAGYVSLEVSPALAHDAAGTVAAGTRLHAAVGRDNLLIKVPATVAGLQAISGLIAQGINVNVTLMFSLEHVEAVGEAYLRGLAQLHATGGDVSRMMSVASLFLSRVDTLVDKKITDLAGATQARPGYSAVAMAKLAYRNHQQRFQSQAFSTLQQHGARPQYLLWASTGTKNPDYSDLLYVEPLIGAETINTLPDATLAALLDHGVTSAALENRLPEAQAQFEALAASGIDMHALGEQLQREGLQQFEMAFDALLKLTE